MVEQQLQRKIRALTKALQRLSRQNARLRYQRDLARADAQACVPIATPDEEAKLLHDRTRAQKYDVAGLISELEMHMDKP